MIDKYAGYGQNGLMIAVGGGNDGQCPQIAGFVNIAYFDHDSSDTTKVTVW